MDKCNTLQIYCLYLGLHQFQWGIFWLNILLRSTAAVEPYLWATGAEYLHRWFITTSHIKQLPCAAETTVSKVEGKLQSL